MDDQADHAPTVEEMLDRAVKRVRLYATAAIALGTIVTIVGGLLIRIITSDVKAEVVNLRSDLRTKAVSDSLWRERIADIVEFTVVAITEPDTSLERREALNELRRRRHVTP